MDTTRDLRTGCGGGDDGEREGGSSRWANQTRSGLPARYASSAGGPSPWANTQPSAPPPLSHTSPLQQVGGDGGAGHAPPRIKVDLHKLACGVEARGTGQECCQSRQQASEPRGRQAGRQPRAGGGPPLGLPASSCPAPIEPHPPKRDELSLRLVLALPKASSSGLDSSTWGAGRGQQGVGATPRKGVTLGNEWHRWAE